MEFFEETIGDIILSGLYYLLQGMGAIVRWIFFLGNKKPEYLLAQKHFNAFVAVFVFAICIGLGSL